MPNKNTKTELNVSGKSSAHSLHERLKAAFRLEQQPWWFRELMDEIVDAIEPQAKEFYAECKRQGHPGPFTARECYEQRGYDPWKTPEQREFILGFGKIADGAEFVPANEAMAAWRAKQAKPADIKPSDD